MTPEWQAMFWVCMAVGFALPTLAVVLYEAWMMLDDYRWRRRMERDR